MRRAKVFFTSMIMVNMRCTLSYSPSFFPHKLYLSKSCIAKASVRSLTSQMCTHSTNERKLEVFRPGNVVLENGYEFKDMKIVFEIHGTMNSDKSNVILHPTSFGAQHTDLHYRIGPGSEYTLDTRKYCVIVVNLLGNGVSSSPSNFKIDRAELRV